MTWTEEDRIREVRRNTQLLSKALYDGEGTRRVHLHHVSHQEETAYLGQHLTLRDGKYITKHIYAGETHIASKRDPDWFQQPPTLYFHTDQLGSASFVSNDQQELVQHAEYFPTGELWQDESDSRYEHYRRYLFNGKEMDISTGLFQYGARHYDPRLGLWMSPDPILAKYMQTGDGLGVHSPRNLWLYSMTGNNPVNFIDRDGKCYDAASCQAELYGPQLPAEYVEARNEGRLQLIKGAWNALVRSVVGGPAIVPYAPPQEQQRAVEQAETREDAAIDAVGAKDVSPGAEVAGGILLAVTTGAFSRGAPNTTARGAGSGLLNQTRGQLRSSIRSFEKLIAEHRQKLADYRANPHAHDNKGLLAKAPSDEVRANIIEGRIRVLEAQIKKQEGELQKVKARLRELRE